MSKKEIKRLRIFAGPNGSGKSTLAVNLKNNSNTRIKLGIFVNADEIESELVSSKSLNLKSYHILSETKALQSYVKENGMSPILLNDSHIFNRFSILDNKVYFDGNLNSYIAADIASFIRVKLMQEGISFSFETVFSHESKLQIMKDAQSLGYRVYLYFITTNDPEINVNRVDIRVEKSGHPVPKNKIVDRYYRSLNLLYDAIRVSYRTFLFDNSGKFYNLIAETTEGKFVEMHVPQNRIPNWFTEYVFDKVKKIK